MINTISVTFVKRDNDVLQTAFLSEQPIDVYFGGSHHRMRATAFRVQRVPGNPSWFIYDLVPV